MEFEFRKASNGAFRCYQVGTDIEFGAIFQKSCQSPEWKAALTVFEKYKRKMELEYSDLRRLMEFVMNFSEERKSQGKNVSNDYLIQIASKEIKTYNLMEM